MIKKASFLLLLLASSQSLANSDEEFTKLADKVWQYSLHASPLAAGYYGLDPEPSSMPDLSVANLKKQFSERKLQLSKLRQIDVKSLSEQNKINHAILLHRLQNEIDEYRFKAYQIPLTSEGGFHTSLGFLPRFTSLKTESDIEHYLARLAAFPGYFETQINHMKAGLAEGNSQPQIVLTRF